ncbi:hypothetical protein HETIRDRAFT_442219 [Heterobasidion irregulare TC 32-1]|uniref:Uncharacterized protein n=1 Tax=Heterobasidion irregulare (strain TC 32-1) TaxID=747525 RepID=W4JRM6_HETIT|nr:uncharacterized protein HETIRDRAFT_442219 [Heterobasidion irregulare TC 32-1]ETW75735.1 hypothetical protein HETIRDRAFT_442219 [Heterobasidion irregulare TC 32-1]
MKCTNQPSRDSSVPNTDTISKQISGPGLYLVYGPIVKDTLPDKEDHSPSTSPAHLNETSELVPHDQSDKGQFNEEVRTDACRPIPIPSPHLWKTEKSSTDNDNMDDDDIPGLVSEDEMRADLSEPNHVPPKLFRKGKQPARPLNDL